MRKNKNRRCCTSRPLCCIGQIIDDGEVARVVAKGECDALFGEAAGGVRAYFDSRGTIQVQDTEQLAAWVLMFWRQMKKSLKT